MKHQVIAITGCIAATTSISGIANTLPENLLGLNLGEISTNSFINKPFKGVIPLHSISYTNAKNLDVKLASPAIFNQIGAEMHPVLNNLSFNIVKQSGKPVILISSDQPVQLPFLNFILEIQGPDEGIVYQDYTVLLDPETKQVPNQSINSEAYTSKNKPLQKKLKNKQKYKVKSGDTLSIIAKSHKIKNVSLKKMSQAIYKKNPRAFVKGDRNKIKRGYALKLPTVADIRNLENTSRITKKKLKTNKGIGPVVHASSSDKYVVTKGDTLSKITRKFVNKDNSFTQLMNAIYINNPEAFVQKNKSLIKSGVELDIPLVADKLKNDGNNIQNEDNPISVSTTPLTPSKNTLAKSLNENNEISPVNANIGSVETNTAAPETELVKRIRELRKELEQSKELLSGVQKSLDEKEKLLEEKDTQLESLKATIEKKQINVQSVESPVEKGSLEIADVDIPMPKGDFSIQEKPENTLAKTGVPESSLQNLPIINASFDQTNNLVKFSTIQDFIGKNYAYLTLASLFGLLLISYRRKNDDSYSTIIDSNVYTPLPDDDRYELKEKNINFYDPKMDEEFKYGITEPDEVDQDRIVSSEILIDSSLTEATEDLVDISEKLDDPTIGSLQVSEDSLLTEDLLGEESSLVDSRIDLDSTQIDLLDNTSSKNIVNDELVLEDQDLLIIDNESSIADLNIESEMLESPDNEVLTSDTLLDPDLVDNDLFITEPSDLEVINDHLVLNLSDEDFDSTDLLIDIKTENIENSSLDTIQTSESKLIDEQVFETKNLLINEIEQPLDIQTENLDFVEQIIDNEPEVSLDDFITEANGDAESVKSLNDDAIDLHPTYESKENSLENNIDTLNKLVDEQKTQQIEHCDELITEFYNGLGVDENISAAEEWDNIEKVCDSYIDQYKDSDEKINDDGLLVDGVSDFNHMMTNLLESLDKADNNLKNTMINEIDRKTSNES